MLMVVINQKAPLNYSLCNQTVTVYRADNTDGFKCTKKVYEKKAFLDFKKAVSVDKTGNRETNSFLLVIKGNADLKPKDKVLLGVGGDIKSREEWAKFIPSTQANLVVIESVDPKYYNNEIVHVEAVG